MKDLLDFVLKNITTHPDDVVIDEGSEDDMVVYTITVHPDDMGRVIGKSGKVINAIRTLVRVAAVRTQQRVRVNLADSGTPPQQVTSEQSSEETITSPEPAVEQVESEVVETTQSEPTVEGLTKASDDPTSESGI